jgi:hypothetical protein
MIRRAPTFPAMPPATIASISPASSAAIRRAIALVLALACLDALPAVAAPADELRADVDAGRSAAAYARCATLDAQADPGIDLWCGIAAVDMGHPGEGLLALERHVLRFPDDARGRLELARAYYYGGDNARARAEFERVARLDPPPEVVAAINRYLDAIAIREAQYLPTAFGYVEVGAGYDSNANAGVGSAAISLPLLGPVKVPPAGVAQGSAFGWLAAGAQGSYPIAPGVALFGAVNGNGTYYSDASEFNLANVAAAGGVSYQADRNWYAMSLAAGEILLDGSKYRTSTGVGLEWRRTLSPEATFSLAPQYARLDYAGNNFVWNSDFFALAAHYRQAWLANWQPVLNASAWYGDDHNREGRPDLGRNIYGISADVTVSPNPLWALNAAVSYAQSDYDGPIPLIEVTRQDRNFTAGVGAVYLISRGWSVRGEYQYIRNDSNIDLYTYSRQVVAVKLRYEYR